VAPDDTVWVLDRPNDLRDMELKAELNPPTADCCTRPPSMIHIDKNGNVIGSFDPPQGHGMDVDSKGFVYIGNAMPGRGNTVRKYDPKDGKLLMEVPRVPVPPGAADDADAQPVNRVPGRGSAGPVGTFPAQGRGGAAAAAPPPADAEEQAVAADAEEQAVAADAEEQPQRRLRGRTRR
jgi:hypothetical protein